MSNEQVPDTVADLVEHYKKLLMYLTASRPK